MVHRGQRSRLRRHFDNHKRRIFGLRGVSWVYVFVHLNSKESPRLHRVSVTPFHFFAALRRGSASVLFALVRVPTELFAVVLS